MKVKINNQELSLKVKVENEYDITKCLRSLKKYNMGAYKQFTFGENTLKHVKDNEYRIDFDCDIKFEKIYGQVYMTVEFENDQLILKRLEPHGFWITGYRIELETYKGVPVVSKRDKFKIDLLEKLGELK